MLSLKTSVSLLPYNTFRIDAKAKYFVKITSEEVLKELFDSPIFKQEKKQILGGGAKVFFTEDFEGLVIKMEIKGITTLQNSLYPSLQKKGAKENITVRVGA
ncbi:MAG: hypothetical protein LBG59_04425 [Candidatus Peribacteria bacterium]|jgi:UDP-N-acetylmuramate dehydrogenase|nr:hypothetical protein [Candidatus Peribacteria bacterium]